MIVLKVVKKKKKNTNNNNNNNNNKTKAEISGLSPYYFQGRVWPDLWPGIASLCGLFCVLLLEIL